MSGSTTSTYRGRFAPSPTGALHAGSLVAALGSWLDARAAGGAWLVRMEDTDTPRCVPGADAQILRQLAACGLLPDEPVQWQSRRGAHYRQALDALLASGLAYPCGCTRADIAQANALHGNPRPRHGELVYPGTCRDGLAGRPARAWRFRVPDFAQLVDAGEEDGLVTWHDRRLAGQQQDVAQAVGDFVLLRADGIWAYQLAVVVDDAAQAITHVVRGEDLADNTARQILLQRALGLPQPVYMHLPLVLDANGEKLSKQTGATALLLDSTADVLAALDAAAATLGLRSTEGATPAQRLQGWVREWGARTLPKMRP